MSVYQRSERWMVYYHDDLGKRHDKSFGRGVLGKAKAEAFEQAVLEANEKLLPIPDPETVPAGITVVQKVAEVEQSRAVPPASQVTSFQEPSGITLSELGKKYLDHMRASGRTEKHIRNVERLLDNQFVPVIGDKPVDVLTYQGDMVPFILHFKGVSEATGKERSQYTVNKSCDYLSFIFNFGMENGFTKGNPLKNWKKPRMQPWDLKLTLDDARKIMEHAEPHLKWAMEVCFNLGTRPGESELLSLRWENVNFAAGIVRIYASKTKIYRTVPINPEFLKRMEDEKKESVSGKRSIRPILFEGPSRG